MQNSLSYWSVMQFPQLPYYLTIKKVVEGDTVSVIIESSIHVEKVVKMPTSFSIEFVRSRHETFRADVLAFVINRYGLKKEPVRYS